MKRSTWNTYRMTGYTHDVANDQLSAGGVHLYQVRRIRNGGWQTRICQSNGCHVSYGEYATVSDSEGELLFARAQTF